MDLYLTLNVPTPKQTRKETTRDDRLRIQTLYNHAGFIIDQIALQLNFIIRQIEYALQHPTTPQRRARGRNRFLRHPGGSS